MAQQSAKGEQDPRGARKEQGGTIVRGDDGALYFLRDDLLEECRMPKDLVRQAEQLLRDPDPHRESFRVGEARSFEAIGRVEGQVGVAGQGFRANMAAASTVMCPSFLFSRTSFPEGPVVNPAARAAERGR